jgi:cell division protein FtsB
MEKDEVEIEFLKALSQYGVLGLWTASLLFMNWQQRKEQKEQEKTANAVLKYHQEMIVAKLANQEKMLATAIEKIDRGLGDMRQKYAEDRLYRLKDK